MPKSRIIGETNGRVVNGAASYAIDPVVIAGAGPVGCSAALYLARMNIPVIVIEAENQLPMDLRASTFHPPTLDLLDQIELTEKLIPLGLKVHDYQYRDRKTNEVAKFQLKHLNGETAHSYRLQCEQFKMTQVVVDLLKDYDCADVRMGTSVTGFKHHEDHVDVLCFDGLNETRIRASYLIGTDGANSVVRRSAGVMFNGLTYPERFLVVSTQFPFEDHFENLSWVNYVSDPDEWCVMLKTVDLWRILVPTAVESDPDLLLSDEFIESRLQRLVPNDTPYDVYHRTLYRVHQRVAETFRPERRVLLAGDAAHVNNPLGGMGMNGGVHDAFNLCEKLVEIIINNGDQDELLDLYDRQRREICVQFVQDHTRRNKALMEAAEKDIQAARQREFMKASSDPVLSKQFLMKNSMINCLKDSYQIS